MPIELDTGNELRKSLYLGSPSAQRGVHLPQSFFGITELKLFGFSQTEHIGIAIVTLSEPGRNVLIHFHERVRKNFRFSAACCVLVADESGEVIPELIEVVDLISNPSFLQKFAGGLHRSRADIIPLVE